MQFTRFRFLFVIISFCYFPCALAAEAMMEEIIVTAQKRSENLQETPVSVTAFTAEAIEALGFRQSVDITAQTPNFSVGYPNGDTGVPAPLLNK